MFDYKFDRYIDFEKRTEYIIQNVKQLVNNNWKDLYKSVRKKAIKNQKLALSMAKNSKLVPTSVLTNLHAKNTYNKELYFLQN